MVLLSFLTIAAWAFIVDENNPKQERLLKIAIAVFLIALITTMCIIES